MKKNWFYLFLLMAIAAMPLTSCDDDDEPNPENVLFAGRPCDSK